MTSTITLSTSRPSKQSRYSIDINNFQTNTSISYNNHLQRAQQSSNKFWSPGVPGPSIPRGVLKMKRHHLLGYAMSLLLALCVSLSCIISPAAAFISPRWPNFQNAPKPANLNVDADLYVRADSLTDATDSVATSKPTGNDGGLTWDQAVGKGKNLVRLLDTEDLSECGIAQSNFTKWEAMAQNGWASSTKTRQTLPRKMPPTGDLLPPSSSCRLTIRRTFNMILANSRMSQSGERATGALADCTAM